jgi:hypothetical protein
MYLIVFRLDFKVVKEGRILKKIKYLHLSLLIFIKPSRHAGSFSKTAHWAILNAWPYLVSGLHQVLNKNGAF